MSTLGVSLYAWNRRTEEGGQAVFPVWSWYTHSTLPLTWILLPFLIQLNILINWNVVISARLAILLPSSGLISLQLHKLSQKHFDKHILCNIEQQV